MPAVSVEERRWRLTGRSRYGGGVSVGSRTETVAGCGVGMILGGERAGTRGSSGPELGGPVQSGPCVSPDLLCQRRHRRVGQSWVEVECGAVG